MRYDIEDIKTGKTFEIELKLSEFDAYFEKHKNHRRVHLPESLPGFGDPIRMGHVKPPADFQKGILDRIKHSVPGAKSGMNRTRWPNIKEV